MKTARNIVALRVQVEFRETTQMHVERGLWAVLNPEQKAGLACDNRSTGYQVFNP